MVLTLEQPILNSRATGVGDGTVVAVGVMVGVLVSVGVNVGVDVNVGVTVGVDVAVGVAVGVGVGSGAHAANVSIASDKTRIVSFLGRRALITSANRRRLTSASTTQSQLPYR